MARIYGFRRYALVDDDFYFLPNPPPERMKVAFDEVL
jgi:hypothetical protein